MNQPMRVLVLSSTYPRYAADTVPAFVHQLSRLLVAHGEVHVLAPHDAGARFHEVLDGVHIHRFPYALPRLEQLAYRGGILENLRHYRWRYLLLPGFLLMQAIWLMVLMRRYRFTVLHAHWLIPQGMIAAAVTCLPGFRVPFMVTSHGGDLFSLQGGGLSSIKRWVLRHASVITVVSRVMRERLLALGVAADRVAVAPMGVDLQQQFVPAPGPRAGIVFVGRMAEKKGVDTLLQAIARLRERGCTVPVTLVGSGPRVDALQQLAQTLGLHDLVWAGAVPPLAVPAYFQRARIAVVPSRIARDGDQEGLGLVCVEALGCACALVASDLPAIRDVVNPGHTGCCVPPDDPEALAQALEQLIRDPALCERLANAGRQAVRERFDWTAVSEAYAALLAGMPE